MLPGTYGREKGWRSETGLTQQKDPTRKTEQNRRGWVISVSRIYSKGVSLEGTVGLI